MSETDPTLVQLQLDIGNLVAAGADPYAYLSRYASRIKAVHLKDLRPGFTPDFVKFPETAPFGQGVIDWPRMMRAIDGLGPIERIIEQEMVGGDSLASQAQAYAYLSGRRTIPAA